MRKKENNLIDCLTYLSLRNLPEKWDKKAYYLMAVVEVQKADGSVSYAIQKRNPETLELYIVKDFGSMSVIREIKNIYPYEFLKEQYVFQGKKEEKIKYLKTMFPKENIEEMDTKQLNKLILKAGYINQLQQETL